jgi:putative effector of murein hydrolase LrgA (UPF0299 family)
MHKEHFSSIIDLALCASTLIACAELGRWLCGALSLKLPGPVAGLLLLIIALKIGLPSRLQNALDAWIPKLLNHLGLLFIPAGVGVIQHTSSLSAHGAALLLSLLVSTAAGALATAFVFTRLTQKSPETEP